MEPVPTRLPKMRRHTPAKLDTGMNEWMKGAFEKRPEKKCRFRFENQTRPTYMLGNNSIGNGKIWTEDEFGERMKMLLQLQ